MLVNLPADRQFWKDTHEGGMAFFMLIPQLVYPESRQVCLAGGLWWPEQDAVIGGRGDFPASVDGGLLIGSTGESLWSDDLEGYFEVNEGHLTEQGTELFRLLQRLYGEDSVRFVTLLDT